MVIHLQTIVFSIAILYSSQVNGEYKYGFQGAVRDYPDRIRELLPDGIPQNILDFYVPKNNLSKKCVEDSKSYLEGLKQFQPWALKMLDSSSKFPSGIMRGHLQDLGNYDECLHMKLDSPFETQFCMIHFPKLLPAGKYVQENLTEVLGGLPLLYPELVLSMCLPASCSLDDMKTHYKSAVEKFNATASVTRYDCTAKNPEKFSTFDWIAVVYLVVIVFMVTASTLYELFIIYVQPTDNSSERTSLSQLLISFSVINNGRVILKTTDPNRSLGFINGMRFFSIIWILISHHYFLNAFFIPTINHIETLEGVTNIHLAWQISASLAVDTFFVLAGFLIAYLFLNMKSERFNVFFYYFHRYMRYAPALITTILLSATLFNRVGDGPIWNLFTVRNREHCQKNWWTNLLFLNNYINIFEQCASYTWFLCVDMQLYILSPLVLLPMRKYKNFAYTVLPIVIVAAMTNSFYVSYINEAAAGSVISRNLRLNKTMILQYSRAHIRVGPYLVGMILGQILHNLRNRKFNMPKFAVICGWTLTASVSLCTIYSGAYFYQDDYVYEKVLASLYTATIRTIWAICIAWVIFACETGYGGPLQKFLSWRLFQPLGRLTFILYMVHPGLQFLMLASVRGPSYYSMYNMARNIGGEILISIFLSFGGSVLFEAPFRNLENIILKGLKKNQESKEDLNKLQTQDEHSRPTAAEKVIHIS